jgi:hypothetical protein
MDNGSQPDRTPMSQTERDVLTVMAPVLAGERTQAEAARLLRLSVRQVRRLQRRLEAEGDPGVLHRLRGRPSNRRLDGDLKAQALAAYRDRYADFGPTLAAEKLAGEGLAVAASTLRRWLSAAGLWQPRRQRDEHRRRRPRRECFGELVQMDTSLHEWTEGRGEPMVLTAMIDDATNRLVARFYEGETVEAHFDLLGRWLRAFGRPAALYTDRDSIFVPPPDGPGRPTQFGRACAELGVELIRAHSPQAKGRVERYFGLAQDRWVKELRLAEVRTRAEANRLVGQLQGAYNRRFTVAAGSPADGHRPLAGGPDLAAVLSVQEPRVVANDYTVRWQNRLLQIERPALPGLRGGTVVVERRLDGSVAVRFGAAYLRYTEVDAASGPRPKAAAAPKPPEDKPAYKPPPDHPWRKPYKRAK